jgi:hypothetical protein
MMRMKPVAALIVIALSLSGAAYGQARPKITGVSHLSVYASDAAKTEHFYVHDLGAFKAADPENPAGVRYYFNSIQFVEVLPLPADLKDPKNRFDHAAYNTADAEAITSRSRTRKKIACSLCSRRRIQPRCRKIR